MAECGLRETLARTRQVVSPKLNIHRITEFRNHQSSGCWGFSMERGWLGVWQNTMILRRRRGRLEQQWHCNCKKPTTSASAAIKPYTRSLKLHEPKPEKSEAQRAGKITRAVSKQTTHPHKQIAQTFQIYRGWWKHDPKNPCNMLG